MALVIADRVRETTSTTGTGTITLTGAFLGFQPFSVIGDGNTTYYAIIDTAAGVWEVGVGTYATSGNTLARTTVLSSSSGGAAINFAAGTKDVICTQPSSRAVLLDSATNATIPGITLSGATANGVAFANASKVLTTGSALTFDGTQLNAVGAVVGVATPLRVSNSSATTNGRGAGLEFFGASNTFGRIEGFWAGADEQVRLFSTGSMTFSTAGSEQMRLTSTGLKSSIAGTNADPVFSYTAGTNTGIFFPAADKLGFTAGGGTDQMVLTSTGLGIGTSSPLTALSFPIGTSKYIGQTAATAHQAGSVGSVGLGVSDGGGQTGVFVHNTHNGSFSSQDIRLLTAEGGVSAATERARISSDGTFRVKGAGSAGTTDAFQVAGTAPASAMVLDSAGNLGLGVTPSAWSGVNAFEMTAGTSLGSNATVPLTFLNANCFYNGSNWIYKTLHRANQYIQDATEGAHKWFTAPSGTAGNAISFTQAMTLDASGNLLVGTTDKVYEGKISVSFNGNGGSGAQGIALIDTNASLNGDYAIFINSSGNVAGKITHNGTTTVAYTTTSDYRLKTVIGPVANAGQRIDALQPIEYTWNASGERTRGFLAHQFQEVYAGSVSGTKDAVDAQGKPVYQAMQASTSEVIADLVAEIKSLRQRLAAAGI